MSVSIAQFKSHQRSMWSSGDYSAIARHLEDAADDLVHRLGIMPGMRVLDVATGTGNAAILAAKAGAEVIGVDLCPELFDEAQARADDLGLSIEWREGDAEDLPYRDAVFDRVLSTFGVAFAPRHRQAARELVRVLRPNGRFGLCNWAPVGIVGVVFDALEAVMPRPEGFTTPASYWGREPYVRELFDGLDVELEFAHGSTPWVFGSPEDCLSFLEEVAGPIIAAKAALTNSGQWEPTREQIRAGLVPMVRQDIGGCWVDAEYLLVTGRRLR